MPTEKKNTTHPASLILLRDALAREGKHIQETTLGEVETTAEGEGLCAVEFRPKGLEPVTVAGLSAEQADAIGWMFAAADHLPKKKPRWEFAYDEEDGADGTFRGVLTDGSGRFLFFRTWEDEDTGADMCAVYNSIRMTDDTEECRFEWDADNDALLLECLNSLEDPDDYCGEGSPVRTTEFRNTRMENREAGDEAARLCSLVPQVTMASYDVRSDRLSVLVVKGTIGPSPDGSKVRSATVHLCPDFGYYSVLYRTEKGKVDTGGMFAHNGGVAEEISKYPFIHEKEPDWLVPLLEACRKAGRDPSWIEVAEENQIP